MCGCGRSEHEIIMVTEAGFAPYEYYEDGEIVGVDIDIAKEVAKELGKELIIKDVAFDSIIHEIKTGKSDLFSNVCMRTKDRKRLQSVSEAFGSYLYAVHCSSCSVGKGRDHGRRNLRQADA